MTSLQQKTQADTWRDPDMSMVDELAVEFACNGTRMHLNLDERVVAARRMCGTQPNAVIAERIGSPYLEEVFRILKASGAVSCPRCSQVVWPGQAHCTHGRWGGIQCEGKR